MKILVILGCLFLGRCMASESGFATYYTVESCKREGTSGVFTANGEKYDESAFTCARRSRKWGTKFKVTNKETGLSVILTLNDYGPERGPTAKGVIIDLTPAAFKVLGAKKKQGKMEVEVEEIK